jgi:hypothetical protein
MQLCTYFNHTLLKPEDPDKIQERNLIYISDAKGVLKKELRLSGDDFIVLNELSLIEKTNNFELLKKILLVNDPFRKEIEERFGSTILDEYKYIVFLSFSWHLANLYKYTRNLGLGSDGDLDEISRNFEQGIFSMLLAFNIINDKIKNSTILSSFQQEIEEYNQILESKDIVAIREGIDRMAEILHSILSKKISIHRDFISTIDKVVTLSTRLISCDSGIKEWRKYEDICLDILDFIFVPSFSKVLEQVATSDNHERRDAVIPNSNYTGLWNSLRLDYGCNNIIVEFKNKSEKFTKGVLNQLRIYLMKPTIGKFGMLFVRSLESKSSNSIRIAQRNAFEQSKILILIFDDEKLIEMMLHKSIYGSVDGYIEELKTDFELNY